MRGGGGGGGGGGGSHYAGTFQSKYNMDKNTYPGRK